VSDPYGELLSLIHSYHVHKIYKKIWKILKIKKMRISLINRMLDITILTTLETAVQMRRFFLLGCSKIFYCTDVNIYV